MDYLRCIDVCGASSHHACSPLASSPHSHRRCPRCPAAKVLLCLCFLCNKFITAKPRFCRPSQRPVGAAVRGPGLLGALGRGGSGVRGGPDRAAAAMAAPGPTARLADLTENALFPRAAPPKRPVARSFWAHRRLPGAPPLPARLGRGRRPRVGLQEAPKVAEVQTLTKARLGARRPPSTPDQRVYSRLPAPWRDVEPACGPGTCVGGPVWQPKLATLRIISPLRDRRPHFGIHRMGKSGHWLQRRLVMRRARWKTSDAVVGGDSSCG